LNKFLIKLKSWYGVLFLVLLAGGILWFIENGMPHVNSYLNNIRSDWEAKRLQAQWEKPYREDTYGGKTPEETYDMFLDALRKGDTTLASKYFVVDEQEKWKKTLDQYKTQKLLANFVNELENIKKTWVRKDHGNIVDFQYKVLVEKDTTADFEGEKIKVPAGNYTNETELELNIYTKIWKITLL